MSILTTLKHLDRADTMLRAAASLLEPGEELENPEYLRGMEDIILRTHDIPCELRDVVHQAILTRVGAKQ